MFIYETHSRCGESSQRLLDVVYPVGDVVEARAPASQELPDSRLWAQWLQELDVAVTDIHQDRLDPLFLDLLPVTPGHPQRFLVQHPGLLEVLDGHAPV